MAGPRSKRPALKNWLLVLWENELAFCNLFCFCQFFTSHYLSSSCLFPFYLQNRPFAQLLSGLETGHPAAAGPSPPCDFSVSVEQKAVFLVSVLDCSEWDSSGLDHLNSRWSIARLREYFRRKIGHSWTARKPSFLNGKRPYLVTFHSTHRVSPVSLWQVRLFEFGFGFLKLKLELRSSERVLEKKKRTQSIAVQGSRASWTPSISQSSPGTHTACTPPVLFQVQPEKKASWHKLRLRDLFPLLSASFQKWVASSFGPNSQKRRRGQTSRFLSMRLRASYSHLGDMRAKTKHRWHCTCFREVSCLSRFQRTGRWKSPQALRHEHESEHFSQGRLMCFPCIRPCCWGRGSSISQPDEWQVKKRSLNSLDRLKLWDKGEGIAMPRLEQRGTQH